MKLAFSPLLICCLLLLSLTTINGKSPRAARSAPLRMSYQLSAAEMKEAHSEMVRVAFKKGRDLLLRENLPFYPDLLLSKGWRNKIKVHINQIPKFREVRHVGRYLSGAYIAHTLYIPERAELKGATVILAKNVIYEGSDVKIKGNYDFHVFPIATDGVLGTTLEALNASGVKYLKAGSDANFDADGLPPLKRGGRITIDTHGAGRKEFLERQEVKHAGRNPFHKASYASPQIVEDQSGTDGVDGSPGTNGSVGVTGTPGNPGTNGTCGGNVHGAPGSTGGTGGVGSAGDNGKDGTAGKSGHPITYNITDTSNSYAFYSNGGDGGHGGPGGMGGTGGDAGAGGAGGTGATCTCQQGGAGNGGPGGNGGSGGTGGPGGNGGKGGDGGDAGLIKVTYPVGYDTSRITTSNSSGTGGIGGNSGSGGNGGRGGARGSGGLQGSSGLCPISFPTLGVSGSDGGAGGGGAVGSAGAHGKHGGGGGISITTGEGEAACNPACIKPDVCYDGLCVAGSPIVIDVSGDGFNYRPHGIRQTLQWWERRRLDRQPRRRLRTLAAMAGCQS